MMSLTCHGVLMDYNTEDLELPISPTPTNPLGAPVDIEEDVTEDMLSKELEDDVTFARAYAQRRPRAWEGGVLSRPTVT